MIFEIHVFKYIFLNHKNILVLTYWSFENALVQTYTLPYVMQIRNCLTDNQKIYLFTLSQNKEKSFEIKNQIESLKKENIFLIEFKYNQFGIEMILKFIFILPYLIFFCYRNKIKTLHAWCTTGGALAYIIFLFVPAKIILDSFEPHAESMVENKTWKENSFAFRLLFRLEKCN